MLNTSNLRSLYTKIQDQLFYLIPEKWDRIYLYSSITERKSDVQTGEMFFYYFPKGILKKNAVNVYEVPIKFNIDEKSYNKLIDKLYDTIKQLRKEFEKQGERLWSSLTISICDLKFNVEYDYENLQSSPYNSYDRHIIWKYKNLKYPIDKFSKTERNMLEKYLWEEQFNKRDKQTYSEGMYKKKVHNIIEYDREEQDKGIYYEEDNSKKEVQGEIVDKYELYKRKKAKEDKINDHIEDKEENKKRNQILNY